MKILILHQHFNLPDQGGPLRSYFLARALVEKGFDVTIIGTHNKPDAGRSTADGINIIQLPVPYSNYYGYSQRVRAYFRYARKVIAACRQLPRPSLVYAMSTPLTVALPALWLRWIHGIPYCFETGDLWPDAPVQLGFVQNRMLIWCLRKLERTVYNKSIGVVTLSPDQQRIVQTRTRKPIHLIPNMADIDFFKPVPKVIAMEQNFKVPGKFVVTYAGAVSYANGLDYVLGAAKACMTEGLPVHFFVCGEGNALEQLKSLARKEALTNLIFLPFRKREGVRELLAVTDAELICFRDAPILTTGCPNKYFDGLAAGKVIITNFNGWISREISEAGCGFTVGKETPADLAGKLKSLIQNPSRIIEMKAASRRLAETQYSRPALSDRFARLMQETLTTAGQ